MHQHALSFDVVVGDFKGVIPGFERFLRAGRFYAVIRLGEISGEGKVVRVQSQRLAIELERAIENLLFVNAEEFASVLAEEENGGGEVLVIDGFARAELDGPRV